MNEGWIGVDLDGTLAEYDEWRGPEHIGAPVPAMVERVNRWLNEGREVRIFTARVSDGKGAAAAIAEWSFRVFGVVLPITCVKDFDMIELWDDRCVAVEKNTGRRLSPSTRGLD